MMRSLKIPLESSSIAFEAKEDVAPLDTKAVGHGFEPPFNEFEHSSEPNFHG